LAPRKFAHAEISEYFEKIIPRGKGIVKRGEWTGLTGFTGHVDGLQAIRNPKSDWQDPQIVSMCHKGSQGEADPENLVCSTLKMVGDVNYHALETLVPPPVEERGLDDPRALVVQQALPPAGGDKFRQDDRGQLTIVVLPVGLVEEVQQRADDGAIG
jgi:hypothetical protein